MTSPIAVPTFDASATGKAEWTFASVALGIIMVAKYFGLGPPYHQYLPLYHQARFPDAFQADQVLADSVYFKASAFFKLLNITGLPIESDVVGLTLRVILTAALVWMAYGTLTRRFGVVSGGQALSVILVSCFLHANMVIAARPSLIAVHSSSPTGFAHILGFMALFAAVDRRYFLSGILSLLCIALAPKGNFLLVPVLLGAVLLARPFRAGALISVALPIVYMGFVALFNRSGVSLMPDETLRMAELILIREQEEASFFSQPWTAHGVLLAAFATFPFLLRRVADPGVRNFGWSVLIMTLGAYGFMLIYAGFGYQKVPILELFMISVPRGTKFFSLFYVLVLLAIVYRSDRLAWYQKIAIGLAVMVFKPHVVHMALAAAIAGLGVFGPWVIGRLYRTPIDQWLVTQILSRMPLAVMFSIVTVAFVLVRMPSTYASLDRFDPIAFQNTGTWSSMVWADENTWHSWRKLAAVEQDFPLLAIYRNGWVGDSGNKGDFRSRTWRTHPYANVVGDKAPFPVLPPHGYRNPRIWWEAQRREVVLEALFQSLEANQPLGSTFVSAPLARKERVPIPVHATITDFLSARNMGILIPAELVPLFPADLPQFQVGGHVLLLFWTGPLPDGILSALPPVLSAEKSEEIGS